MQTNNKSERAQIGTRLKAARQRAHISVADAAAALGVQPLAIERWERGAALPCLIELKGVMQLYGVMACDILFEENPYLLAADHVSELAQRATSFSPGLRSRVDSLIAMLARGKEPVWRKAA